MLTDAQKKQQLLNLAKSLRYSQRIVCSDEGNLHSVGDIYYVKQRRGSKPIGVWYSFGPAWIKFIGYDRGPSWCKVRANSVSHVYKVRLTSVVLRIDNAKDFDRFEKKYADVKRNAIFWDKVAKDWAGVEIRYLSSKDTFAHPWYEGWDCSSGCIWHQDAVSKIELLQSWERRWI